ncbi:MAG: PAS domain S-box protein [Bacillota bacterium]
MVNAELVKAVAALSLSYEIALSIGQSFHTGKMLQQLVETLVRGARARSAAAWLYQQESGITLIARVGPRLTNVETLLEVLSQGQPVVFDQSHPKFSEVCSCTTLQVSEVLLFPIGGLVILELAFPKAGSSQELIRVLERLSPRIYSATLSCLSYEGALNSLESRYREVVDSVDVGIYRSTVVGRFMDANPAFLKMFRLSGADLLKLKASDFYADPEERRRFLSHIFEKGAVHNYEILYKRRDGTTFWGNETATLVKASGRATHILGVITDVTERKLLEQQLRESELRYRLLAENVMVGVYLVQDGLLRYVNPAFASMFGYRPEEIVNKLEPLDLIHPEDRPTVSDNMRRQLQGETETIHYAVRGLHRDGSTIIVEVLGSRAEYNGRPCLLGSVMDVTHRKLTEAKLEFLSTHDSLTGLYNRAFFEQKVQAWNDDPTQYPIAVIMADVNDLKYTNDTMGHHLGDETLKAAASVLRACFRSEDLVARIGGDEFAAVLPHTPAQHLPELLRRIRTAIKEHNSSSSADATVVPLSVAVGAAVAEWPKKLLVEAIRQADSNMYVCKETDEGLPSPLVGALLSALVGRSLEREEQLSRLKQLCMRMAETHPRGDSYKASLSVLALAHDIGKTGLPDSLFLKPGPLSQADFLEVQRHVEIGYRIARATPHLAFVAKYILHHHERWDGTGYPAGLKGEEIPVQCRIFAIADAYDAMISSQPYRPTPLTHEEALGELSRWAGKQFDPELVSMFIKLMR